MDWPLPKNEKRRLKEIEKIGGAIRVDPDPLDQLCRITARLLRTPISIVSLVGASHQCFAGRTGVDSGGTPRDVAFSSHAILQKKPFIVEDASRDPRFANSPHVVGPPHIAAYAAMPLEIAPNVMAGTLCAIDLKPRPFTSSDIEMLVELSKVATAILATRKDRQALSSASVGDKAAIAKWKAARVDLLTGLPNLVALREAVERTLADLKPEQSLALFLINLSNFKAINEVFGHAHGDDYLKLVGKRLQRIAGKAKAARIGGDEFAILAQLQKGDDESLNHLIDQLGEKLALLSKSRGAGGGDRAASMGIAFGPEHGVGFDELHRSADLALQEAKVSRRKSAHIYHQGLRRRADHLNRMKTDLRGALKDGDIVAYFQPRVHLETGAPVGFEVLARWRHRKKGVLSPAEFNFAFNDDEFGPKLTDRMSRLAAECFTAWSGQGYSARKISINVSTHDLLDPGFVPRILSLYRSKQIRPEDLSIEVTEHVLLGSSKGASYRALCEFRKAGVRVSLDDFGTGFATLQHLRNWPIDSIKIDKSFVGGALSCRADHAIVRAICGLASALNLEVTAEGIETTAQLDLLRTLNCELGQGYLFSPALPADEVPSYLSAAAA